MIESTDKPPPSDPEISIIIPCYNEESNIGDTLKAVLEIAGSSSRSFEIIPVNDGSRDHTLGIIREFAELYPTIRPLDLLRNFGQTLAYQAGLDAARGKWIVFFSGDLEIPASEIFRVVEQLDAGFDFVNTHRRNRWGGAHALKSKLANALLNAISGIRISDRGSGLKGMSRQVAKSLRLYGEWHRFLPDIASIHTSRITEFEVEFKERKAGVSSYKNSLKTITVFLDLASVAFTVHSQRKPYQLLPGRFFGFTGLVIAAVGFVITAQLITFKLFMGDSLADRPLFFVSILMTILGFIMVMMGVIGEWLMQLSAKIDHFTLQRARDEEKRDRA